MSYMDRNETRWEIQFLDIWSGLIQKGSQVRCIVGKAVWSGDEQGWAPTAQQAPRRMDEAPIQATWKGSPHTVTSQLEMSKGLLLAVVRVEFSLYLHR